jgi:nucleotide sugar dehydrogenase
MNLCVVGLGKIGIPLAVQFASRGAHVIGYDIDTDRCDEINSGRSPLHNEPGVSGQLATYAASGAIRATTNAEEAVSRADVVILIVPVDVDDANRPDFSPLDRAVDAIGPHVHSSALVIVETTVPVGTTRNRVARRLAELLGMTQPAGLRVAFSPERVSSGTVLRDLERYPKIVGGVDSQSAERAAAFYREMLNAEVIVLPDAETAEYSKLIETTYRDVNIALANEFAKVGDSLGVDARAAIAAANTQPYSHVHQPGPGVGGHCIPVYPYFVGHPEIEGDVASTGLIAYARQLNDAMASYCAARLGAVLGGLSGAIVIVLGLAYRANVKESRHSSTFGLAQALRGSGADVFVHDPLFSDGELRALGLNPPPTWPFACDAIVVQAWHDEYADLNFNEFPGLRAVFDTRANVERRAVEQVGVRYVGLGTP